MLIAESVWAEFVQFELKKRWSKLTHEDIRKIIAEHSQLKSCLQKRYKITEDAAKSEIDSWLESNEQFNVLDAYDELQDEQRRLVTWAQNAYGLTVDEAVQELKDLSRFK